MMRSCTICSSSFTIDQSDLDFLGKVSPIFAGKKYAIPPPTLCPDCRLQRRIAFRNERKLYHRTCGLCSRNIVSQYSPDKKLIVYCPECFWSDKWSPLDTGRPIDFSQSFTEQLKALLHATPILSNVVINSENCEFNSFIGNSKNCFMSVRVESEEVYYCYLAIKSLQCFDSYSIIGCQYCYECIDCWQCYNGKFLRYCRNCSDCSFCFDCIGCRNCFGCAGLRNAEYHFFNRKCGKEEYEKLVAAYPLRSHQKVQEAAEKFEQERLKHPVRALIIDQSEDAEGDYIFSSRDVRGSFDIEMSESVRYSWGIEYCKDVWDSHFLYYGEQCYEHISNWHANMIRFTFGAYDCHDLTYCMLCFQNSHDCFGCVSGKKNNYCILNKQYTKEKYESLCAKIIAKMEKDGEWGEFLHQSLSPFGYNETIAQEYFPLGKADALTKGFSWSDFESPKPDVKTIPASQVPDDIAEIPDDILNWAVECEVTSRPFRIVKAELDFYRQHGITLPRRHPDQRHFDRVAKRNPKKLWKRDCAKCGRGIQTSYSPNRPEKVYCEECYLKEVY